MPCACKLPAEKYPETAEWGPLFWNLLHGLAELAGNQKDLNLQTDEMRLWINIITSIQNTIPCDVCRDHYARWLADHPPAALNSMPYALKGPWIRRYWWALHNEINEGNEKPVMGFEELSGRYKGSDITGAWKRLEPVIKRAITLNGITLMPWKKWLGFVRMLQGMYGV
jgi:hypothetical protein